MRRVLLVDDDVRVLDGLRRTLRPFRNEWDMTFALGGPAALAEVRSNPFDVVVTDMRMPDVDGATLLRHVYAETPHTVRIVLSGQTDQATAMRTMRIAHQFLSKPCEPGALHQVIDRCCALQSLLGDELLRQTVGGVDVLPGLPQVYAELARLAESADTGVGELAEVVEQDPALCAKLLQLVNSSYFGLARSVSRMEQAISYLGINIVRSLVLSHEICESADRVPLPPGFSIARYQAHALLTANIARTIMRQEARALADDAFMAGMLHDIGELLLATRAPTVLAASLAEAELHRLPLDAVDRARGGATHATAGAYLLGLWNLPFGIVEAVAHHHCPSAVGGSQLDLLAVVHVADVLAQELAGTPDAAVAEMDSAYLERVGCAQHVAGWRALAVSQFDSVSRGHSDA